MLLEESESRSPVFSDHGIQDLLMGPKGRLVALEIRRNSAEDIQVDCVDGTVEEDENGVL